MGRVAEGEKEKCREFGNGVIAEVDFRSGSRWLLRVKEINGTRIDPSSPRITVPDAGTELVVPQKVSANL